jgi:hypothetical protein
MIAQLLYQTAKRYEIARCFPEHKRKIIMQEMKDLNAAQTATLDNLVEIRKAIDKAIELVIFESNEAGLGHLATVQDLIISTRGAILN